MLVMLLIVVWCKGFVCVKVVVVKVKIDILLLVDVLVWIDIVKVKLELVFLDYLDLVVEVKMIKGGMCIQQVWQMMVVVVNVWIDDFVFSMGVVIVYYIIFLIVFMLVIVIVVVGMLFGYDVVQGEIVNQICDIVGIEGVFVIQGLLKLVSQLCEGMIVVGILVVMLVIGVIVVFLELQSVFDCIWCIFVVKCKSGLW